MNNLISIGMQNTMTVQYQRHSHRYWEITYYFEGSGTNITGDREYAFEAGTIICQPPQVEHEDISTGYKNIYFMVEHFDLSISTPLVLHDTINRDFLYILKKMYNEYYSRGENHGNITNPLLYVLYQYMLDLIKQKSSHSYVDLFEAELIDNLSNPEFSIIESIQKIPMCEDYFRRLFKNEKGTGPQEYLQNMRISYSMQLLKNSSLPLKNICLMCGYTDPYYYSRVFKKCTSMSPDHWRRQQAAGRTRRD